MAEAISGTGTGTGTGAGAGGNGGTPPAWYADYEETTRGYIENKKWDSPKAAVESYIALDKVFGAEKAGRTIVPPTTDAKPEEWDAYYAKLGRPEKPELYDIGEKPENWTDFTKSMTAAMHKVGVPQTMAKGMVAAYNDFAKQHHEAAETAYKSEHTKQLQDLQKAWGKNYDINLEIGTKAIHKFLQGEDAESVATKMEALRRSWGVGATAKFFHALG